MAEDNALANKYVFIPTDELYKLQLYKETIPLPEGQETPDGCIRYEYMGAKNGNKQRGVKCPACHLTATHHHSIIQRTPEMMPTGVDIPAKDVPKVDQFECEAAVIAQKSAVPCEDCKVCSSDERLMAALSHPCNGLPNMPLIMVNPGMKCINEDCDFKADAVCKCKICSVARHSMHFALVFEPSLPLHPFPLYPRTFPEDNSYNFKRREQYLVKEKAERKERSTEPNFVKVVLSSTAAALNRLAHDPEGIMTLAELERQKTGAMVDLGANETTKNAVREAMAAPGFGHDSFKTSSNFLDRMGGQLATIVAHLEKADKRTGGIVTQMVHTISAHIIPTRTWTEEGHNRLLEANYNGNPPPRFPQNGAVAGPNAQPQQLAGRAGASSSTDVSDLLQSMTEQIHKRQKTESRVAQERNDCNTMAQR